MYNLPFTIYNVQFAIQRGGSVTAVLVIGKWSKLYFVNVLDCRCYDD